MLERGGIEIVNLICDHRDVPQCVEKEGAVEMNGKKIQDATQLGKELSEQKKGKEEISDSSKPAQKNA